MLAVGKKKSLTQLETPDPGQNTNLTITENNFEESTEYKLQIQFTAKISGMTHTPSFLAIIKQNPHPCNESLKWKPWEVDLFWSCKMRMNSENTYKFQKKHISEIILNVLTMIKGTVNMEKNATINTSIKCVMFWVVKM